MQKFLTIIYKFVKFFTGFPMIPNLWTKINISRNNCKILSFLCGDPRGGGGGVDSTTTFQNIIFKYFHVDSLQYNITKHCSVIILFIGVVIKYVNI